VASAVVAGCADEKADGGDAQVKSYGYVPLLTGKVAKLDPDTLEVLDKLGSGHSIVHGVAVVDGRPWLGNRDDSTIELIGLDRSVSIGKPINRLVAGGGFVAASGDSVEHPFGAHVTFLDGEGAVVASAAIALDEAMMGPTSMPVAGAPVPLQECSTCPRTGVALHEGVAWVIHTRNHALYKIDPSTGALDLRIDIAKPTGPDAANAALSPFLAVCPTTGRVATPDLYARRVSLFTNTGAPDGELSTAPHLAIEVDWSPDGATLYVLTAQSEVIIGDESANALIPTEILAVDAATLEVTGRTRYSRALNHVTVHPGGASLFATTTSATVVRFDALSLTETGAVQVAAGAPPALDVYF